MSLSRINTLNVSFNSEEASGVRFGFNPVPVMVVPLLNKIA